MPLRILQAHSPEELKQIMRAIKVDPYGIKIMAPKATTHLIRINSLPNIAAIILKQEMLSLGADAALPRGSLSGRIKNTDCVLMGSLSQFNRLKEKLKAQPFGLKKLGRDISSLMKNYHEDKFHFMIGRYDFELNKRTHIMGVINLTPDSFSGDGIYNPASFGIPGMRQGRAFKNCVFMLVKEMVKDGADIIDIGGQSSRPGCRPVSAKEEIARVIPLIKFLAQKINRPISIDTDKPQVARAALDNGAVMLNDISGLRNKEMRKLASRHKAAVVIMHMKGTPRTMQDNPVYRSLIDDVIAWLDNAINKAAEAGIERNKIIIDPGIGFGKTLEQNLEILKRLKEFKSLGLPILVGPSRKSFLGKILNALPRERVPGTIASCVLAASNGANIVRVHDVRAVAQALKVADSITSCPVKW